MVAATKHHHPPYTITIHAKLKNFNFKFNAFSFLPFWSSIQSQYSLNFKISPRITLGIDSKKGVAVHTKNNASLKSKFFRIWKKTTSIKLFKKKQNSEKFRNQRKICFSHSSRLGMIRRWIGILIKNNLLVILTAVIAYIAGCLVSYLNFWSLNYVKEIIMEVILNLIGV